MPVTLQQYLSDALRDGHEKFEMVVSRNAKGDIVIEVDALFNGPSREFVVDGDFVFDVTRGKDD